MARAGRSKRACNIAAVRRLPVLVDLSRANSLVDRDRRTDLNRPADHNHREHPVVDRVSLVKTARPPAS